ncbi:MAG: 1-(5-phosphoribosyl)-5-[(5-phosphoribosylamino)methylideneamino] imidazole-4-carboxamide isomerase [Pseudobdellovibrionaceae bacterium]
MILIPAIDLSESKVVRLKKGAFADKTFYPQNPNELIQNYIQAGSQWIHLVDLDGAQKPENHQHDFINNLVQEKKAHFQVGGGLRTKEQIEKILATDLQRVVLSSFVFEKNQDFKFLVKKYGSQRFCVALDIKLNENNQPEIFLKGWQEKSPASFNLALSELVELGIEWILCTDIDRDGLLQGPNFQLYKDLQVLQPQVNWIASGGVRHIQDVVDLAKMNIAARVVGKALLENLVTMDQLKDFNKGIYAS